MLVFMVIYPLGTESDSISADITHDYIPMHAGLKIRGREGVFNSRG